MKNKYSLLVISIILDLIGLVSFVIPGVGEFSDIVWAPIAAYYMLKLYKGMPAKVASVTVFLEEILPWTDFIPTFTIMWIWTTYFKKENFTK